MKYYKNEYNDVYAYESDGSQDEFINKNLMRISEKEALEITNPPPTQQQLIAIGDAMKDALLIAASEKIAPLQDAIDLNIATDKELVQLNAWKQYRVDLNRIDTANAPDINWPEKPQ